MSGIRGLVHVYDLESYGRNPTVTVCGATCESQTAVASLERALRQAPPGTCGTVRTARPTGLRGGEYEYVSLTGQARHDEATGAVVWTLGPLTVAPYSSEGPP